MPLAMPPTALTLLVATAGLAAVAFALLFLHAATRARDDADAASRAALHTYYLDLEVLEQQPTVPLPTWALLETLSDASLDDSVATPQPHLGEQSA
jgi:hypothetical protein